MLFFATHLITYIEIQENIVSFYICLFSAHIQQSLLDRMKIKDSFTPFHAQQFFCIFMCTLDICT